MLNDLSIKTPFQLKIATLNTTGIAKIYSSYSRGTIQDFGAREYTDATYSILSRETLNDTIKLSFKAQEVYGFYFDNVNGNRIIHRVGLRFLKEGTYIIFSKFHTKIKKNKEVENLYLEYLHNETSYTTDIYTESFLGVDGNLEFRWDEYIKFDIKKMIH